MSATYPERRSMTAREAAERFGISPRTVQRFQAEPRERITERAAERRAQAVDLRRSGQSYAEIATAMNCSRGSVGTLLHHARLKGEWDGSIG